MKKIIYVALILFVLSFFLYNENNPLIPQDSIRFRIIANSNSNIDQSTKLQIKQDLEKEFFPLLENAKNLDESRKIIMENDIETYQDFLYTI